MEKYLNQTDTEPFMDNSTLIHSDNDRHYDGDFTLRSIILSFMVLTMLVSMLCCHRERISKCFESYLTTNGHTSDTEYATRVWRQHMENEAKKMETPEKRKARLWGCIEKNAVFMIVQRNCFFPRNEIDSASDQRSIMDEIQGNTEVNIRVDDCESGIPQSTYQDEDLDIQLPHGSKNGSRRVPNSCAICLSGYDEGDKIVWSSNEECKHAFHDECILIWLTKNQNGTPCPCCRCEFTDLYPNENDTTDNEMNSLPFVSTLRVRYSPRRE